MMGEAATEERTYHFEHQGDEVKTKLVAGAEMTLAEKVTALFKADGLIAQVVQKAKERGPPDFPERRRRHVNVRLTNGDKGNSRLTPWLVGIFALLLILVIGVGVALYKLNSIEQGQHGHDEQRIERAG